MEYKPIKEAMNEVMESCDVPISREICKITLYNMATMYMRIRAFTLAKDIVQKEKIAKREKAKAKALRKTLKKSDESTYDDQI